MMITMEMNRVITFVKRPIGKPEKENFEFKEEEYPRIKNGEILLKTKYVSVDPYLRGRMKDADSFIEPFKLNEPLISMIIAEVVDSKNDDYNNGEYIRGMLSWKQFQSHSGDGINKLMITDKDIPLSAYLGVLGLTGLTAYLALKKIGTPKIGETLLVSGAAGAVGSIAGQIGKLNGCRVVGIAGSDEKINHLIQDFGFDAGINYKSSKDMHRELSEKCPNGVDIYFDNVGGEILDTVMQHINEFARIVNCGAISNYNKESVPKGMRLEGIFNEKRAKMQGFSVLDHTDEFTEAVEQLSEWIQENKLQYDETIRKGFDTIPSAFIEIFEGKNTGKMLVEI